MIADNIKSMRIVRDLKQSDIALKLNVSQGCYSSWEQGRTEPNIDMLSKLADIFECSVDYLLGRTNDIGLITVNNDGLSDVEKNLLAMFRKLDKQRQAKLYAIVQVYVS